MKTLAIGIAGLLVVGAVQAQEVSALVFGKSYHPDRRDLNEANYGAGLEIATNRAQTTGTDWQWLAGGYALKDSCNKTGYAGYGGGRATYTWESGFHVEATLRAGYLQDCYYGGPAALPSVGIGYGRVTLEYAYIPKLRSDITPVHVVWLRVRF